MTVTAPAARAQAPPAALNANEPIKATASTISDLARYESTGLSLLHPYTPGKIPVVFVHGLWSSPWSWDRMIKALETDDELNGRYQFWTFGYATGDPIPYSASLLRHNLEEARRRFDPQNSDPAFARMVIVGHSMGGLLSKMMVVDSGDRLWHMISDRKFEELSADASDRDIFRQAVIFRPRPEIRRVVFIATPHQGSHVDRGSLQRIGTRLVRLPDPLRSVHHRLIARNDKEFFKEHFRKGLPTSIDELEWGSPILKGLHGLNVAATVKAHSIIAVRKGQQASDATDGLVTYASAHLEGVESERVVTAAHLCQDHPEVIHEVRRILVEHEIP
ncbi:esterase/lipase family protein [Singulisphaera sp. PoT]|uniref:esterase/lipase family protein n=1 Tax=Singulisphaera sp. PoT TaxID=3411797 RepID=UPI003BF5AFCF